MSIVFKPTNATSNPLANYVIDVLNRLARERPEIAELIQHVEARPTGLSILTPEGEIVILFIPNPLTRRPVEIWFRPKTLHIQYPTLRNIVLRLEQKLLGGTASGEEIALYTILKELLKHYLPSGYIEYSPQLMSLLSSASSILPYIPEGERFATHIIHIGSSMARVRPLIELLQQLFTTLALAQTYRQLAQQGGAGAGLAGGGGGEELIPT